MSHNHYKFLLVFSLVMIFIITIIFSSKKFATNSCLPRILAIHSINIAFQTRFVSQLHAKIYCQAKARTYSRTHIYRRLHTKQLYLKHTQMCSNQKSQTNLISNLTVIMLIHKRFVLPPFDLCDFNSI